MCAMIYISYRLSIPKILDLMVVLFSVGLYVGVGYTLGWSWYPGPFTLSGLRSFLRFWGLGSISWVANMF
jgi:hypothetical protein